MKFNLSKYKLKPISKNHKGIECLNCGMPMSGNENFCSYCGQKNTTKKLSFGVFVNNMISGIFSYDSRFWRTFIPLLSKPGSVSKQFIQGKRVKFVNPFQLYLNVSIIFFLVLGINDRMSDESTFKNVIKINETVDSLKYNGIQEVDSIANLVQNKVDEAALGDSTQVNVVTDFKEAMNLINSEIKKDSLRKKKEYVYHIKRDSVKRISILNKIQDFNKFHEKNKSLTNVQGLDSLGYKKTFWNKFYYQRIIDANVSFETFRKDGGKSFYKGVMSHVSIALFVFLPVFTLFLWLIYFRRKFTYMEHLVFVFHTQTVFFLLLSIFYVLNFFIELSNFGWVFVILFLIYLYKALRNFYGQGRLKTILKFLILNSYYMFLAMIGLTIVSIIAFVMN